MKEEGDERGNGWRHFQAAQERMVRLIMHLVPLAARLIDIGRLLTALLDCELRMFLFRRLHLKVRPSHFGVV